MILTAALFAPTVPSEPRPQNLQAVVPTGVVSMSSPGGSEVKVTSSTMLSVNRSLGTASFRFSKTGRMWDGMTSLEPRP